MSNNKNHRVCLVQMMVRTSTSCEDGDGGERPDLNCPQAVFNVLAATKLNLEGNNTHAIYPEIQELGAPRYSTVTTTIAITTFGMLLLVLLVLRFVAVTCRAPRFLALRTQAKRSR